MTATSRAFDTVSRRPTAVPSHARSPRSRSRWSGVAPAALTALLLAGHAAAAPAASAPPAPEVSAAPADSSPSRPLAVTSAVVPGLIVHGAGHYVLDEKRTARNLLIMEGVGFGLTAVGGLTVFFTGASRYFIAPAITAVMTGGGLIATGYFADIYGTANRDGGAVTARLRAPVAWETELGYRRVYDPQFAYRDFLVERVSHQIGAFRFSPSGWFSTRGDTARYRLEGQYRVLGATAGQTPSDASFLDVTLGFVHQRHRPERFTKGSAELAVDVRYDLGRLGRTLRGSFVDLGTGYALGRMDYDATGVDVPSDFEHLLLGHFGFGILLRGKSAPGSEVAIYYEHRHDDYAAGLKSAGIASGNLGHLGLGGRWYVSDRFGFAGDVQVGSAYVGGVSLLFRPQGVPARQEPER